MTLRPSLALFALAALAGCDSNGGAAAGRSCQLVGPAIALPYARYFDVAALGSDFVVVLAGEDDVTARVVGAAGASAPEPLAVAKGAVHLASRPGEVLLQTFPLGWQLGGPRLARFDGAAWTTTTAAADPGAGFSTRGAALAADASHITAAWVDGVSSATAATADWDGATFGPATPALTDAEDLSGYSLHLAYDAAGRLHLATLGTLGATPGLLHASRAAGGSWGPTRFIGPVPDATQNTTTTGLATDTDGGVWFAEVHAVDFFADTRGALTVWRDDGTGAAPVKVGAVGDDRLVVEGLAVAGLAGARLVASASWGANNLDAAASDDSVLLYVCAATGGCARAATLDGRRGTFFEATRLATAGSDGLAVWAWTRKGVDGAQGTTAQRFTCAP